MIYMKNVSDIQLDRIGKRFVFVPFVENGNSDFKNYRF